MAVTVKQIAEAAGVSHPVVSKVLYGGTSTVNVSIKRREEILRVAKEMGFTPDWRARAFREKRTRTVGLLTVDRDNTRLMSTEVLAGLVHHLGQADYQLGFATPSREKGWRDVIGDRRYDGCLIDYYIEDEEVLAAQRSGVPLVLLNTDPAKAAELGDFPLVGCDYEALGAESARQAIAAGAGELWLTVDRKFEKAQPWFIEARLRGARRAADEAGTAVRQAVWSEAVEALRHGPRDPHHPKPGIVTTNTFLSELLIPALMSAGLSLPGDVVLVGAGSHGNPAPTYVAEPYDLMTEYAVAALMRLMRPGDDLDGATPGAKYEVPGPGDVLLLPPGELRPSLTTAGRFAPDVNY